MQWEADPGCSARKQLHSSGVHRTAPLNCTQQIYQAAAAPHLRSGRKTQLTQSGFPTCGRHTGCTHGPITQIGLHVSDVAQSSRPPAGASRLSQETKNLPLAGSAHCLTQRAAQPAHHHTGLMRLAWCLVPPFVQLRSRADAVEDLCLRKWGFLPQ
jgi:hypothetical protein